MARDLHDEALQELVYALQEVHTRQALSGKGEQGDGLDTKVEVIPGGLLRLTGAFLCGQTGRVDFRAQIVFETHTYVPTGDTRILSDGTAYVTDVGMTGGTESIIGFSKEDFLGFFLGRRPPRIGVSKGPANLSAVLVEVEIESRRATGI